MRFLFVFNTAPYIIHFMKYFAKFLEKKGHICIIYISTRAAENFVNTEFEGNKIKVIRRRDIIKDLPDKSGKTDEVNWIDFHATWDRKVFWYGSFNSDYKGYVRIISATSNIINRVLEKAQPDVIIQEPPANLLTSLFYEKARKRNIKYIGLITSRIPNRIDIYDEKYTNSRYKDDFTNSDLGNEEIELFSKMAVDFAYEKYRPSYSNLQHTRMHKIPLSKYYFHKLSNIRERYLLFKQKKKLEEESDYEGIATINYTWKGFVRNLRRKTNYMLQSKYLKKPSDAMLKTMDYFLFPLHFQPEASTSAQAPFYCDLRSTIRYISFSLPFPIKLLVKEHPHSIGIRGRHFYSEVSKLPNADLIAPDTKNKSLIMNSRGVITLTSTLGLQAAILGKPVYVLGDVFYTFHPNVVKVSSFEELYRILNKKNEFLPIKGKELNRANAAFFYSYYKNSVEASIIDYKKNNDKNFVDLLGKIEQLCGK